VAAILPSVLTQIDSKIGSRLPIARRLLGRQGVIPPPEFGSLPEVLSLYDESERAKLTEDGAEAVDVPTGEFKSAPAAAAAAAAAVRLLQRFLKVAKYACITCIEYFAVCSLTGDCSTLQHSAHFQGFESDARCRCVPRSCQKQYIQDKQKNHAHARVQHSTTAYFTHMFRRRPCHHG
jgi:hypothetical protein